MQHSRQSNSTRCWFCTTHFYTKLTEGPSASPAQGPCYSYEKVMTWRRLRALQRTGARFAKAYDSLQLLRLIIVPIHLPAHWVRLLA